MQFSNVKTTRDKLPVRFVVFKSNMSSESQDNEEGDSSNDPKPSRVDGNPLLMKNIMNSLRGKSGSDSGSSNGGNNSDNSALVSLGNSMGFNFDGEEGMSSNSKEGQNDSNDDSDGAGGGSGSSGPSRDMKAPPSSPGTKKKQKSSSTSSSSFHGPSDAVKVTNSTSMSSLASSNSANQGGRTTSPAHDEEAANAAVANLQSIVNSYVGRSPPEPARVKAETVSSTNIKNCNTNEEENNRKRRSSDRSIDGDSGGYNTDDDDGEYDDQFQASVSNMGGPNGSEKSGSGKSRGNKKKRVDSNKREERNQREKERSLRISKQISELRNLLSGGGVIVPKGTKSSVLTEAANYIRMLQQHQYRSEIDRHQLVQQMQLIGGGAHGPQAAAAIRHVAAQNGVWSLGNFGGVPPKSAMTFYEPNNTGAEQQSQEPKQDTNSPFMQNKSVDPTEYRFVFNSCGVGMAIASMGGAFIDCNQLFCQLSNYTKQEICSLTIFNLTARQDLQQAFDQISQLISPPMDVVSNTRERPKPVIFRGAMKNRDDLGLSVSIVKGDDGVAKCFCVTLVKNPESPFDTSKPVPVSFDAIIPVGSVAKHATDINTSPAFTSG